jgi:hypothetical protein
MVAVYPDWRVLAILLRSANSGIVDEIAAMPATQSVIGAGCLPLKLIRNPSTPAIRVHQLASAMHF